MVARLWAVWIVVLVLVGSARGRAKFADRVPLRRFTAGRYAVFYRVRDREIEIIRVIHGARDIDTLFGDE